ncbi:GTP-binding protein BRASSINAZOLE INSENSITIVE PALE GREEN 2, chloroplastic isoform X2 [Hordeum vulgare subsp. vulgare]|uniref:GTP-binding protein BRASSINAZOLE INSENSITIVE PALE GREEN 2, chloroplastic isoform X2 n=1 Tax=Hordeum vulgare subsp. vulgare TaxID=112509 RepID=UPI001D1A3F2F|nr:GTP-binding protein BRASSINAZOLE INSENSITIVE PALE GREEN 2, chloroplastic isoform X2 [Hordeum vulgare subsp. vulgare]
MAKPMPLPTPAAAAVAVAPARFPVGLLLHTTPPLRLRLRSLLTPPPQSRCLSSPLLAAAAATAGRRAARPPNPGQVISEGRDEDARRAVCPGCGVFMQDADPDLPGFFTSPSRRPPEDELGEEGSVDSLEGFVGDDEEDDRLPSESDLAAELDGLDTGFLESLEEEEDEEDEEDGGGEAEAGMDAGSGWDSDWDEGMEEDEEEKWSKELDGFTPPGVGYGSITEETLERMRKEKLSKGERKRRAREARQAEAREDSSAVVCARCHSLRNYGHVKNDRADNLIPDFDFDRFISSRLMKRSAGTPVIVMVVDCADFDGSFPKRAAKSLFRALEGRGSSKLSETPRLVLVGTKVDLLPWEQMGVRLEKWVRGRAKAFGAPKLDAVYLVSVHKDLSVRNLISYVKDLAGPRSNVWVIGAQNAGKSTLINAFAKKQGVNITRLTEAAVPGTTLGILRMTGVLPAKAKMYDTPGLLHPYIMSMRLNTEERKMVEIRKELRPRTFRVKAGQSVHIGGLTRLDVLEASVQTIYVTVWASANISLHLGKTENAEELRDKHVGIRLQPPVVPERATELGQWTERRIDVSGLSWDVSSTDIAVSGLGWYSLGLKGKATVAVHTFDGIDVTQRDAMILHRAKFLERPGFLLPIAIANAIGEETRKKNAKLNAQQESDDDDDDDDLSDDESAG